MVFFCTKRKRLIIEGLILTHAFFWMSKRMFGLERKLAFTYLPGSVRPGFDLLAWFALLALPASLFACSAYLPALPVELVRRWVGGWVDRVG